MALVVSPCPGASVTKIKTRAAAQIQRAERSDIQPLYLQISIDSKP
jgi:hypothetical protein